MEVGCQFIRWIVVCTASTQIRGGTQDSSKRVLAISKTWWFFRSTTPFCSGFLGQDYCAKIPFS